jgi:hypothetical protein
MVLKKGEIVVMHTCGEAEHYDGKLWVCRTDEQKLHPKHDYTVVWLEGFSGAFNTKYLQRVDVSPYVEEHNKLLKDIEFWKDLSESCECNN